MFSRRRDSLFLAVLGLAAGCRQDSPRDQASRAEPLPGSPRARRQQLEKAGMKLDFERRKLDELKQHDNGPGLVVCEPVVAPGADTLTSFGRGCARWLQFEAAGQGAASKSPGWWAVAYAHTRLEERKQPPTEAYAVEAMQRLGATHVAVGELSGTPANAMLTYRFYAAGERKALGAPWVLAGSLNDIRKGLPAGIARFSRAAGLAATTPAPVILESVSDLEYLGSLDREEGLDAADIERARLAGLAERSALASLYWLIACRPSLNEEWREIVPRCQRLANQAPTNAAAWNTIAIRILNSKITESQPKLSELLDKAVLGSPRNAQLAMARALLFKTRRDWKYARAWSQEAIRCNTRDPEPLQVMASCLRGENEALSAAARKRGGPTTAENEQIWTTNTYRLELAQRAAALDPGDCRVWEAVSYAAMLQRQPQLAEEALRKAVEHGPRDGAHYWWGLHMYGPAYLNDPAKRARFAEIAASAPLKRSSDRIYMAQLLHHRGLVGADGRLHLKVLRTADERKQLADWVAGKPVPWGGQLPSAKMENATTAAIPATVR